MIKFSGVERDGTRAREPPRSTSDKFYQINPSNLNDLTLQVTNKDN